MVAALLIQKIWTINSVSWNVHGLAQPTLQFSSSNLAVNFEIHARVFSSAASADSSSLNCTTLYHQCVMILFTQSPHNGGIQIYKPSCKGDGVLPKLLMAHQKRQKDRSGVIHIESTTFDLPLTFTNPWIFQEKEIISQIPDASSVTKDKNLGTP